MSFPAYLDCKDTEMQGLGNIPVHWEMKRLKDVATHNDEALGEDTPDDAGYIYVDISSVNTQQGIHTKEEVVFKNAPSRARRIVRDGDVIVSTVRTYLKAIARVVEPEQNLIVSTGFAVVRPRDQLDPSYAGFLLLSNYFIDEVISRSTGVSYPAINASDLVRIHVPLPPLPEQTAIASFLDTETSKIDGLVSEQRRLIELLKEKRQAVISHAVTKGLNPDVRMKPSGIQWLGDVPEHWEVQRVKTVTSFVTSGPRGWSERIAEEGSLFIQSGDLNDTLQIEFENSKRVQVSDDAETTRTQLFDGDVVICVTGAKTGNVAVCFAVPETAYVNQHLCLVRPNDTMLPMFLGILLKCDLGRTYFDLSQYGLKQGLSLEDVKEAPVLVPPVEEQRIIVDFLEAETAKSDSLIAQAERAIELLQERRTALISAAVIGKIDVRGYKPDQAIA